MTNFREGDLVRHLSDGGLVILEWVNDNPNYEEDEEIFASGELQGYGTVEFETSAEIELVTAREHLKKTAPTVEQVVAGLDLLGDGWGSPIDVTETEVDGNTIICYGYAANGKSYSFRVTVSDIWED